MVNLKRLAQEAQSPLVALFDSGLQHSVKASGNSTSLLFGYHFEPFKLSAKSGRWTWTEIASDTVERARAIVGSIDGCVDGSSMGGLNSSASTSSSLPALPLTTAVKRLDALSDSLCSVLDATELVQNVHPDPEVVEDAKAGNALLTSFMNQLNTHQGLYNSLNRSILAHNASPSHVHASTQTRVVADLLIKDFQKSGIHLGQKERRQFVEISDDILNLGYRFVRASSESNCEGIEIENPSQRLAGVYPQIVQAVTSKSDPNLAVIPIDGSGNAHHILRSARDEDVRRVVYMGMNEGSDEAVQFLEGLLLRRKDLAHLLGKRSYADMWLGDKMAGSTENVLKFLSQVSAQNKPMAEAEIARLISLKKSHQKSSTTPTILHAWDKQFYSQFLGPHTRTTAHPESLRPYFSVGRTLSGISSLLQQLYGVRLEPCNEIRVGEVWHKDVRKLHVVDEDDGVIGVVYMDLFKREESVAVDKFEGAAQFTVRCSRRLDDYEAECLSPRGGLRCPETERKGSDGKVYQIPIVTLVTQFERPTNGIAPGLLGLGEVETLFHEMGHVMHSVIARTDYQHISGTRCALDFVEVPSNILESFARDNDVLKAIGVHYATGETVPGDLVDSVRMRSVILEAVEKQAQLKMAMLDQVYHSERMEDVSFDTTAMLRQVQNQTDVIPYVEGTRWQTQFSHLFSYGASYYSYFWARRVSDAVCARAFQNARVGSKTYRVDGLREGGEVLKKELLQWGGGRDPWVGLGKAGVDIESL
ncbi:Mitochondrial intermediate peptidase [Chytriomyces hyalinus]|nr:Mitochondrial intermediate peptidase [Chytriomyces hyalinus]